MELPRSLVFAREPIQSILLHDFGDASSQEVAAAVNAVVEQEAGMKQGLVAGKACLAKQGLNSPLTSIHEALTGFPGWSLNVPIDTTVALHWIKGVWEYN